MPAKHILIWSRGKLGVPLCDYDRTSTSLSELTSKEYQKVFGIFQGKPSIKQSAYVYVYDVHVLATTAGLEPAFPGAICSVLLFVGFSARY